MLNGIQILRAIAILDVVSFHLIEFLNANAQLGLKSFSVGVGGLDVFFVISGFILVRVTGPSETPQSFLVKRAARLLPLYWLMTAAAIATALVVPWVFPSADLSVPSVLASFLLAPYPDLSGVYHPILFVGWPLNVELVYFACFALVLMLPARRRLATLVLLLGGVWLLTGAAASRFPALGFYHDQYMVDLMIGCGLAAVADHPRVAAFASTRPLWPVAVVAFFALAISGPLTWGDGAFSDYWRCLPAAVLVGSLVLQEIHRTPIPRNALSFLGDCSYSTYLVHAFLIAPIGVPIIAAFGTSWPVIALVVVLVYAAVLAASPVLYYLIEVPSRKVLRRRLKQWGILGDSRAAASVVQPPAPAPERDVVPSP